MRFAGGAVFLLSGVAALCAQGATPDYVARLAAVVARAERLGVRVGVDVRAFGTRATLYARHANDGFVPASNMKLLTAAAALETLGGDHEFATRFLVHDVDAAAALEAANAGGRRRAHLLRVVSSGDPCLSFERTKAYFAGLAAALRRNGVTRLEGCYLDAPRWRGPARPAGWPRDQLTRSYAAPTGPFVLDEGCIRVKLVPRARAVTCSVSIEPAPYRFPIKGRIVQTSSRREGRRPTVALSRDAVHLRGKLWSGGAPSSFAFAAPDPTAVYYAVLRGELAAAGIPLGPRIVVKPKGRGRLVHTIRSPLSWALRRLLEESSNFQGEQLLRVIGGAVDGESSLEAGRRWMQKRFSVLASRESAWRVADGSGLSRTNSTSPAMLCQVLADVLASRHRRVFVEALPQSGVSGSLRRRMQDLRGRVRAKTGWIRGASSLSGTVLTRGKRLILFSILMNYPRKRSGWNKRLKAFQDEIVKILWAEA